MSSCRLYINNLTSDPKVQSKLEELHNSIFKKITDSKLFRKWNGIHFLPSGAQAFIKAKKFITDTNRSYGKPVIGTAFTKTNQKEYVFVNVKNFVKDYEDSLQNLKDQQIDEFGDSRPMYSKDLITEALSLIEDINPNWYRPMMEKNPRQFLFDMAQQLNSSESEASTAKRILGERLAEIALELFPNAKVGDKLDDIQYDRVDYNFKAAISIMNNLDKIRRWEKDVRTPPVIWSKIQKDLGIPKDQVQLIESQAGNSVEEKLMNFITNYSFVVQVETALAKDKYTYSHLLEFNGEDYDEFWGVFNSEGEEVFRYNTRKEAERKANQGSNKSSVYANLTVPGGTNYTENNINTPAITPSIKGHAQFATDNGIGWFRSDEQFLGEHKTEYVDAVTSQIIYEDIGDGKLTKTRRILEIQSDLFQKGRDKNNLILSQENINDDVDDDESFLREMGVTNFNSQEKKDRLYKEANDKNQFLQLLNKENNWVTFFVKSIIQDSAKKGYEKVLFPSGNTANKVEGQETLEEFIKEKQDRIEKINEKIHYLESAKIDQDEDGFYIKYPDGKFSNTFEFYEMADSELSSEVGDWLREKDQIENEILEAQAGKTKFSAINSFYENTIQNILKKQGYKSNRITDEYGNEWFEVKIDKNRDLQPIAFTKTNPEFIENQKLGEIGVNEILNNIQKKLDLKVNYISEEEAREITENSAAPYNGEAGFYYKGEVYLVEGKYSLDTKLHELIHPFIRLVAKQNPALFNKLYKEASNNPQLQPLLENIASLYRELIEEVQKGNYLPFMEEFLVHVIQMEAAKQINNITPETKSWLQKFWDALKYIFRQIFDPTVSLASVNSEMSVEELTKILLFSDEKIDLRGQNGLWNYAFPVYNRTFVPEMQNLQEKINPQIETFSTLVKNHLNRIRNSNNLKELKEILGNDEHGNPLVTSRNFLEMANKLIGDIQNDADKLLTFAEGIASLSTFSEKMIEHVEQFIDREDVGDKYKIGVLVNYGHIIKDWKKVIEDFKTQLPYKSAGPLRSELSKILDIFDAMDKKMQDYNQNTGLVKILKDSIDNNIYITKSLNEIKDKQKKLISEYNNGNKSLKKRIDDLSDFIKKVDPTEDNIKAWLAGEMGDTNGFSKLLESFSSNPNPIVGSFANFFYKEKAKLDSSIHESNTKLFNKLAKILKNSSVKRNDIDDIFDKITDKVQTLVVKQDGTTEKREVYVFANQYTGDYQYKVDDYEKRLSEFKEKTPEYYSLKKEYEDFRNKYMFNDASDIVAQSRQFWLQSDLHQVAKDTRQSLLDIIRTKQSLKPVTEAERDLKEQELKLLWRRYSRLSSQRNLDNVPKTNNDPNPENNSQIADIIKEYQQKFGNLYEKIEIKDAFDTAKKAQAERLEFEGLIKDTPEFNKRMNDWMRDNIRIANSEKFYNDRQAILNEISSILSKLPDSERKKIDVSAVWNEIFDIIKGFRDEDNQPIGSDLNSSQQEEIKDLENKLDKITENFMSRTGLSKAESQRLYELKGLAFSNNISVDEAKELNELSAKKSKNKLSTEDNERLDALFIQLREFQRKIPTNYYVETFNNWMDVVGGDKISVDLSILSPSNIDSLLEKNEDFKDWFKRNHRLVERYDPELKKYVALYERTYAWNRIIPNEEGLVELIANNNYAGLMSFNSQYLTITPTNDYFFFTLKKQYKTPKIVGVTTDNRGNWLPRPTKASATKQQAEMMERMNIDYAADNKYESQVYKQLISNPSLKDYKDILDTYTEFHLKAQEGAPNYTKLWLEIPRQRKTSVEKLNTNIITTLSDFVQTINPLVKKETEDAFTRGEGNYEPEQLTKAYVMTDLFGNQPTKIPIKYTAFIDNDKLSKDLGGALVGYNVSLQTNKFLHDLHPTAHVLRETLKNPDNAIKMQNTMSKNFATLKHIFIRPKEKNKVVSNMYNAVNNFIEREFEGIEKKYEAGVGFDRFANHIMKLGAIGSLALSPIAATRNLISGNIQKTMEGVTGRSFSGQDLVKGEVVFDTKYIPALIKDYYEPGERSLQTQKFELFDPLMHYTEKASHLANKSVKSDIASLKFLMSMQKSGEVHIQGSAFATLMQAQKVPYKVNDETLYIPYEEAWELKDGVISLKEGVDKSWDKDGENFAQFKLRMQKINEINQGAYAKENQPEAARYTTGALALFMRKYFVPMFMNRFAGKRANYAMGEFREGYYYTAFKNAQDTIKNGRKNWHTYDDEEKKNVLKVAIEVGYSLLFALLISLLGFDDDDDEKYDKLRNAPWVQTYLIYQLMSVKSEVETFIPMLSMGVNEWARTAKTPTVAWNVISKYLKMTNDLSNWIMDNDAAYYDKAYGVYDKGDVKFLADFYGLIGVKNWLLLNDPTEGVKAYVNMQRRY